MENLTPMMRQYHQIKQQHPETILFFRLGDFYEMFYEDAIQASRALDITLTSRNNDKKGQPIPMCGVPYHAAASYLARLLKQGYKVALCDQVENPSQAKGIVKREVTRVLTPGTVIDEHVLGSAENNFLVAVYGRKDVVGAGSLDVSTGEFWCMQFVGERAWEQLERALFQFSPRELVVPEQEVEAYRERLAHSSLSDVVTSPRPDWTFNEDYAERTLLEHFRVSSLEGFGVTEYPGAVSAAGALLNYVRDTQRSELSHIRSLRLLKASSYLLMDESTIRNLELVRGLDGNRKWTLLATLDRTTTAMGARLLKSWMLRPMLEKVFIDQRLEAVQELKEDVRASSRLLRHLGEVHDLERLMSRVTMDRANPRDLLALSESLGVIPQIRQEMEVFQATLLCEPLDGLEDVSASVRKAIAEDAPVALTDGGIIRRGFDSKLDELREIVHSGKQYVAGLEAKERERTGIGSLKVKYNRVFGYFIEVTNPNLDSVPPDYVRKQTLASSERFVTPELKEYEEKILTAAEESTELEKQLFVRVRTWVAEQAERILTVAEAIARLDTLLSFAEVARRHNYARPELNEGYELEVRSGRHPVVELQSSEPFVPNNLKVNLDSDQLLILTGPNMGGKSTYLRQNALIVLMAQMGSFVPAELARIGLVDRIFTRVGASDNLARGRSTFMVEMVETARILNTATARSLVLLDEVGRGTATFDGLSIAWSVAEFLVSSQEHRARTLFATHYQELTQLEELFAGVKNYCVAVQEGAEDMIFFHRVMPGVASKSYGIEVARMAGLPPAVVERARRILKRLERKQLNLTGTGRSSHIGEVLLEDVQQTLFQA